MKKGALLGCFVAMLAVGQDRPDPVIQTETVTESARPVNFRSGSGYVPGDVKVLGVLDYGRRSNALDCAAKQRYRAFVFSGYGGDRVEIALQGENPSSASFAVTDSTLIPIGSGSSRVTVALPYRGPDIEVYYIVFPTSHRTAHLTVQVKKVGRDMRAPELKTPPLITEMKGVNSESNRQGEF
jgi:hypothetical protein